jgi:hypothetical protein
MFDCIIKQSDSFCSTASLRPSLGLCLSGTMATQPTVKVKPHVQVTVVAAEIHSQDEIEALGRRRPESFASAWGEVGFCVAVLISVLMAVCFLDQQPATPRAHRH